MDILLKVDHLFKSFGSVKAVNDVSFEVRRGSFFAFLGPNGAGKSTTINMIARLLNPDAGTILLDGQTSAVYFRNKIGVVFQENILDDGLTVKENLMLRGALYLGSGKAVRKRYNELAASFKLTEFEKRPFKTLSGGQKRRVEIARALFADPEILLLDEPTTGLDPETRKTVWTIIDDLRKNKGITIFLTTHYMEECADADHIVIINQGKIAAQGTPAFLKAAHSHDRLKVVPFDKSALVHTLETMNRAYVKIADQYILTVAGAADALAIIDACRTNIQHFEMISGTLDDVFINIIGEENHV